MSQEERAQPDVRWGCVLLLCSSSRFCSGKKIIRTYLLSKTSSDYVGLVREAGVEPARPCEHWHLKPASLPIPPLAQRGRSTFAQCNMYIIT